MDYENKPMAKSGKYRGEKIHYPDGTGYCIWSILKDGSEDAGICFDFPEEGVEDAAKVIEQLKVTPAREYVPDLEYEIYEKKREEKQKKWWYRLWDVFDDVGITIAPFDWRFTPFFIRRPVPMKNGEYAFKMCRGFFFGPITITW